VTDVIHATLYDAHAELQAHLGCRVSERVQVREFKEEHETEGDDDLVVESGQGQSVQTGGNLAERVHDALLAALLMLDVEALGE